MSMKEFHMEALLTIGLVDDEDESTKFDDPTEAGYIQGRVAARCDGNFSKDTCHAVIVTEDNRVIVKVFDRLDGDMTTTYVKIMDA